VRYAVQIAPSALRALKKLDRTTRRRVSHEIDRLADDPRPIGATKMRGDEQAWRVRVGDYRVIYTIEDAVVIVYVIAVGHRRDIYRRR